MKQRPLGRTGLTVSELGLGAWQLANPAWEVSDRAQALEIVERALELGCTFFDTAPGYGAGSSKGILGQALKPVRQNVVLCSKFGHTADGQTNFGVSALRPALEDSLRRLQTDYLDVYLLHNPPPELLDGGAAPHYEELERFKAEGRIRAYGVSVDSQRELDTVLSTTGSGAAEVLFNAFHQEPQGAFGRAQARGVGLIVKVPLDSGWLSGKYGADSRFGGVRKRWSPEIITRRAALVGQFAALLPRGGSMTHAALQYILAQPQVSTVIAGAKSVTQVEENLAASEERLPQEAVQEIRALWERELRGDPLPW